jgi:hypothetical protein
MIVDDFHIVTMALAPDKTDSPLIIDQDYDSFAECKGLRAY